MKNMRTQNSTPLLKKLLIYTLIGCFMSTDLKNFVEAVFCSLCEVAVEYFPFTVLLLIAANKSKTIKKYYRKFQSFLRQIMSPYCNEMMDDFTELGKDLSPDPQYIREVRQIAQTIFEKLKQDGYLYGLKIGRTKIAGSVGKGTGISFETEDGDIKNPDLDLVVYVNDKEPPFNNHVYEIFKMILEDLDEVDPESINIKKYSVQLTAYTPTQGKIKVDLLAAHNYVKNTSAWPGQDIGNVQTRLALSDVRKKQMKSIKETKAIDLEVNKLSSSAFAEDTVETIRDHVSDLFVLEVVMLAKYWNCNVEFDSRYPPARSCMIETICIKAQQQKKRGRGGNGERCPVSGFRRFLEAVSNLKSVEVSLSGTNNSSDSGAQDNVKPMVRDPVNPWNNLAHGLHPNQITIIVSQAKKTLNMLEKLKRGVDYQSVENAIDEIFCHKE